MTVSTPAKAPLAVRPESMCILAFSLSLLKDAPLDMLVIVQTYPDLCLHLGERVCQYSWPRRNSGGSSRSYEMEFVACVLLYKIFWVIVLEIRTWWVPIEQIGEILGVIDQVLGDIAVVIDAIIDLLWAIIGIPSLPDSS